MRKVALVTAAIVAAVVFFLLATLPPRPVRTNIATDPALVQRIVKGAYHIHSTRSDGAADKDAIAAAAARAGLAFIILTDHGDGMRTPDPPAYLHGVLCLDGVEISTSGGHYVALDMRPAPYPLGGEPSAVVEDVHRLGGFGIVAHPDSPKPELAWKDWDVAFDGIEWLSADSEWRDESRVRLARVLFDYVFRPAPALASLLDRPVTTLKHWDEVLAHRRVVGLAGVDAHGGIGRGMEEGGKRRPALGSMPSYEASFRTFTTRAILDRPFSGDPESDARALMAAIRSGRVFTLIDAIAAPGFLIVNSDGALRTWVDYGIGDGAELFMVRDGRGFPPLQAGAVGRYQLTREDMTGVVRFEARARNAPGTPPVPWIVSNPFYFTSPPNDVPALATEEATIPLGSDAPWHVEKDPETQASIAASDDEVKLEYTLASGTRRSQFAAAATDFQGRALTFRGIAFSIRASHPGRVSVQLRYPNGGGERWGKSVYMDAEGGESRIQVDQMRPADLQRGRAPDPSAARSLLFVADLTNARPGDSNAITISDVRFVR
jgi:hypothetical protein